LTLIVTPSLLMVRANVANWWHNRQITKAQAAQ